MQEKKIFPLLAAVPLALAATSPESAPLIYGNPDDACFVSEFPATGSNKIGGYITFTALDGLAKVNIKISSMEPNLLYHIHAKPVDPSDETCDSTGGHFNPYNGTSPCGKNLSKCEVGDLSGKYGNIDFSYFESEYLDPYLSLVEGDESYIGGKSITFHYLNGTRYACSNIVPCKLPKEDPAESETETETASFSEETVTSESPKETEESKLPKHEKKEKVHKSFEPTVTEDKKEVETSKTKKSKKTSAPKKKKEKMEKKEKKEKKVKKEKKAVEEYKSNDTNGSGGHSTHNMGNSNWNKASALGSVAALLMSLLV
ncbi:hypothetical protein KLU848_4614 [Kluyveromyces marxianus]